MTVCMTVWGQYDFTNHPMFLTYNFLLYLLLVSKI